VQDAKQETVNELSAALKSGNEQDVNRLRQQFSNQLKEAGVWRDSVKNLIRLTNPASDGQDTNYIFLRFVGDYLPSGLVGLIIAIIFLAAWGSIAAALNSLASCTMVDFHRKFSKQPLSEKQEYKWSKIYTLLWGIFCVVMAQFAYNLGNSLIEAVNILGSWFYGTILGIFLVAFYLKSVKGHAVFIAALLTEIIVIVVYSLDVISFLWLNLVGAVSVIALSGLLQYFIGNKPTTGGPQEAAVHPAK
jgi:Na+/proline symporter